MLKNNTNSKWMKMKIIFDGICVMLIIIGMFVMLMGATEMDVAMQMPASDNQKMELALSASLTSSGTLTYATSFVGMISTECVECVRLRKFYYFLIFLDTTFQQFTVALGYSHRSVILTTDNLNKVKASEYLKPLRNMLHTFLSHYWLITTIIVVFKGLHAILCYYMLNVMLPVVSGSLMDDVQKLTPAMTEPSEPSE